MNEVEKSLIIFGILTIFICVPTFFIYGCKCKKTQDTKYFEI
jgi:hypothetical protein